MRQQAVIVNNYLTSVVSLYQESSKAKKGEVLDIAELVTQRSRKQLIKRLSRMGSNNGCSSTKPPGRPLAYSKEELLPHIRYLWEKMEKISAERMKAAFADWLPRYEGCPPHLKLQMEKISASTLKRYLKEVRLSSTPIKGLSTTSPSKYMKNKVPINTLDSQVSRPGYTQTDTVSHCGSSAQGPFISSLTVTDICTTWTECRAIFTKKGSEVRSQIKAIEKVLPFSLLAINSDSGSEFLNKAVFQFTSLSNIQFTRSRPYKKNDNCYIEQKNFTHVRELFGYERFDNPRLVDLMNDIYINYWSPLQNFFLPSFKLKEKLRVGSKIKKKYDAPKTPYQRVIESGVLKTDEVEALRRRKSELNPFELKEGLELKLKEFFKTVRQENIREVA